MKNNKLAACAVLQLLIFAYFWAIGILITNKNDIRKWSELGRIVYVCAAVVISTAACIGYLKNDENEPKK